MTISLSGAGFFVLSVMLANYVIVQRYSSQTVQPEDISNGQIGIVFGGGVTDTEPLPLLKDRLDTAKRLLDSGVIDKVLLSGDNRTLDYNEPNIMFWYLIKNGVDSTELQRDFAGRSTYETCERAQKIFGVKRGVLITERAHLPRAIYLCESFGVEALGVASDGKSASGLQIGQRWREVLASNKAIFNKYIIGEKTILGDPIDSLTSF